MRQRKTYSREFKLEAVRLADTSEKSDMQIERDLGIGRGSIYRWRGALAAKGEQAFPGQGRLEPEKDEVRQLKRQIEILCQERDILKKQWPSFRSQADEVPVHRRSSGRVACALDV
jgi:transposase